MSCGLFSDKCEITDEALAIPAALARLHLQPCCLRLLLDVHSCHPPPHASAPPVRYCSSTSHAAPHLTRSTSWLWGLMQPAPTACAASPLASAHTLQLQFASPPSRRYQFANTPCTTVCLVSNPIGSADCPPCAPQPTNHTKREHESQVGLLGGKGSEADAP